MVPVPPILDHSWHTPYLRAMEVSGVPEARRHWFVSWVELFIGFLSGKPLHAAERTDAEAFVRSLESSRRTESWRLLQAADALRLLLTAVYGKCWEHPRVAPRGGNAPGACDPLRLACRARGYSPRTEASYADWVRRFGAFRCSQAPELGDTDAVRAFLERLAVVERVSPSTQAQALNALAFWFSHALGTALGDLGDFARPRRPRPVPVVLTLSEIARLFAAMQGTTALMAGLLYGTGLRLREGVTLRVKDIDLERRQIAVGRERGGRTASPSSLSDGATRSEDTWRQCTPAGKPTSAQASPGRRSHPRWNASAPAPPASRRGSTCSPRRVCAWSRARESIAAITSTRACSSGP
jgi:hypothetical protein